MKKVITAIVALVILALMAWGYYENAAHHGHGDAKVNPKETIFEHLGDTYGWEVPFSHTKKIPLPIIAFAKGGGLHCFMSSRVTGGETWDDGGATFKIPHEGDYKGKLVQVLDDGRLTDSKGRVVNFKNTIIIMTSNLTMDQLYGRAPILDGNGMVKPPIRPEFLNRIDEIINFSQLSKEQISDIVRLQMNRVAKMLESQGFTLKVTDAAIQTLAEAGFDPDFGARPVKRAIQRDVLNALSKQLLAGTVNKNITEFHSVVVLLYSGFNPFLKKLLGKMNV